MINNNNKEEIILRLFEKLLDTLNTTPNSADDRKNDHRADDLIGTYVIIRCTEAGVHSGILRYHNDREIVLDESRRLWYWKCKVGHSLSGLAIGGLHEDSKISGEIDKIRLLDACEIIPVSENAIGSFKDAKAHNPK